LIDFPVFSIVIESSLWVAVLLFTVNTSLLRAQRLLSGLNEPGIAGIQRFMKASPFTKNAEQAPAPAQK